MREEAPRGSTAVRGRAAPEPVAWVCRACGWMLQTKDSDISWAKERHGEFCNWSHDSNGVRMLTWADAAPPAGAQGEYGIGPAEVIYRLKLERQAEREAIAAAVATQSENSLTRRTWNESLADKIRAGDFAPKGER